MKLDSCINKVPMQKVYMQTPFRELHADILKAPQKGGFKMARDSEGKVIIGQSMLQKLMPPYIKPMSMQHSVVCGCEVCVSADTLQNFLIIGDQKI